MTGITPQQRTELSKLIDEARYAMLELGMAQSGEAEVRQTKRVAATYRAMTAYLNEITDYSQAEAVSGS